MNIIVIGLGSMGKRRIRLIKQYDESYQIFGVDLSQTRCEQTQLELNINTFSSIEQVCEHHQIDCAVVCTSPLSHPQLIHQCLLKNLHVFTELNLVDDYYTENIALADQNNRVLFLSSTFLYRAEVDKIRTLVSQQKTALNYIYHIGQYLPDWHPWESYKDFFVGNKRTNGCREILAIELPWLIKTFGDVKQFQVVKSKMSQLDIDYCDNYMIILEHHSGHKGSLVVDIVSRKATRDFKLFGEEIYLKWDGSADGLSLYNIKQQLYEKIALYDHVDQLEQYSKFVVENAYLNEIKAFFDIINKRATPKYTFEEDKHILKLIDKIEA